MSEPAKKLLALAWAMRYEWIVSAILVYVVACEEGFVWIAACVVLLIALRPVSVMLFTEAIARRARTPVAPQTLKARDE
jgi:hypothetical protein